MNKIDQKLLLAEAGAWAREGLIDETQLARLEARYAENTESSGDWRSAVFFSIGALLVGLGLSALAVANLNNLRPALAFAVAVAPLFVCVAAWAAGRAKGLTSWAFWEPIGILWCIAAVLGAVFAALPFDNVSNPPSPLFLKWVLLLLPVLYATRSLTAGMSYFVGLAIWVSTYRTALPGPQCYWLLAPLGLSAIWIASHESPGGVRQYVLKWTVTLSATFALGFTLVKVTPGLWIVAYGGAFAVSLLAGLLFEAERKKIWQTPMRTLGGAGLAVLNFLLIFKWPWEDIGWSHNRLAVVAPWTSASFDYALAVLLPLTALALVIFVLRQETDMHSAAARVCHRVNILVWGLTPVTLAIAYCVVEVTNQKSWKIPYALPSLICTGQLALLGLTTIASGLSCRKLLLISAGTLLTAAAVCGKIFADEYSLWARGIVFTFCGVLLFAANGMASWFLKKAEGKTGP